MLELFRSPRRAFVWFVEATLLSLLGVGAAEAILGRAPGGVHVRWALIVAAVTQASLYYQGLYGAEPVRVRALLAAIVRALGVAGLVLGGLWWLIAPPPAVARGVVLAALGGAVVVLPAFRLAFDRVVSSPLVARGAIVLGGGGLGTACAALLATDHGTGLRLLGVLLEEGERAAPGARVLGRYADLETAARAGGIDRVIVAAGERRGTLPVGQLLDLKLGGVAIEEGIAFYERVTGKVFLPALKPGDLVFARGYEQRRGALLVKRAFDLLAAGVGLLFALPVVLAAAAAVKVDSPGSAFYVQERAGAGGRRFRIWKLRTMREDAEPSGAVWAAERDPRVTRVGLFLRRSRIDEIPQLWNVLSGEMSLVGPRPERPVFVERLEREIPFFARRLAMKPGVTGHAQVRCRYGASLDDAREKLAYDLFYIEHFSLWFDLSILVDTVKVVLLRIGSR